MHFSCPFRDFQLKKGGSTLTVSLTVKYPCFFTSLLIEHACPPDPSAAANRNVLNGRQRYKQRQKPSISNAQCLLYLLKHGVQGYQICASPDIFRYLVTFGAKYGPCFILYYNPARAVFALKFLKTIEQYCKMHW